MLVEKRVMVIEEIQFRRPNGRKLVPFLDYLEKKENTKKSFFSAHLVLRLCNITNAS
jgi:hypothetical protein